MITGLDCTSFSKGLAWILISVLVNRNFIVN